MLDILLVGAGGHARACIDVIETHGKFAIAGLVGQPHEVGSAVLGYRVIGQDADLPALVKHYPRALVTVGQIKTAEPRLRLFAWLERLGCECPQIVSPRAHVSRHATVGAGTIVMHGAVVNAAAIIGRNGIINTQSLIEHDTHVGDHCHVSTGALLNSGVRVGHRTFIGSGTSVRQGIVIGDDCVIGMGQRVLADCSSGARVPPGRA
jgi:sugar O-acyltransferase (sialic acid O-acetyltransferase NeuD family)